MKYKSHKQYRYKGYNYSQDGFYFVTICAKNREFFFGGVVVAVGTDDETDDGTGQCPVPTTISKFGQVTPNSISTIIGSYKSIVTKTTNLQLSDSGFAWQPRFHDHIIRNEIELNKIKQYIIDNPYKWHLDRNNMENLYM